MISYKAKKIKDRLLEFSGLMVFRYHGVDCDIDPFSPTHFHVVYNGVEQDVNGIDEVMEGLLFGGSCLNQIAEELEILEW